MADPLTDLFTSAAQAKLAGQGGYGKGGGFGKFLNVLLPALAGAMPNAPLFQGAEMARQAVNTRNYNKYAQAVAQREFERQQQANVNNDSQYFAATGQHVPHPEAGFDTGLTASMVPKIRLSNQAPNNNAFMQGQPLKQHQYGDLPEGMMKEYMERQAAVADTPSKLNFLSEIMDIGNMANAKPGEPVMQTDPTMLSGKVSESDLGSINPYTVGALSDAAFGHGISFRKNEQDNVNTQFDNQTERQHYERTDALSKQELADKIAKNFHKKWPPQPSGSNQNPMTVPKAIQDFYNNQVEAIDSQLAGLGVNTKLAKWNPLHNGLAMRADTAEVPSRWFDGKKAVSAAEASKNRQINSLLAKRQELLSTVSGTAFGGGQAGALKQSTANMGGGFSAWKAGKKK